MASTQGLEVTEPARRSVGGGPLPITASRTGHLHDALTHAYRVLRFEDATGGDDVFAQLVLARIIEPVSKLDSLRVLEEAGITARLTYLPHRQRRDTTAPGRPWLRASGRS